MKKIDILYGLEILIFNYKKLQDDYTLIQKLIEKDYADWFSWYDDKIGRYKHKINATQKGLSYYATKSKKGRYRFKAFMFIVIALIPLMILLSQII